MSKVVASYLVRVTLREREADPERPTLDVPEPPTNDQVARLVRDELYESLPYFGADDIRVTSERTDI